jgi:hypothetical protein
LEIVMATSPEPAATTVAETLAVLFGRYGSRELLATDGVAVMTVVPGVTPTVFTFTVSGILTDAPDASVDPLQLMVPVPPTAGVVHVHPAGGVMLWNVVFAGTVML